MAFEIYKKDEGGVHAWEYLAAGEITPKVGMALTQTNGLLAVCGATVRPSYICMTQRDAAVASGTVIPVIRVNENTIFETVFSVSASSIKPGNKVTLASDGLRVTATTSSGVAEVISMDGTAAGDKVRVRF